MWANIQEQVWRREKAEIEAAQDRIASSRIALIIYYEISNDVVEVRTKTLPHRHLYLPRSSRPPDGRRHLTAPSRNGGCVVPPSPSVFLSRSAASYLPFMLTCAHSGMTSQELLTEICTFVKSTRLLASDNSVPLSTLVFVNEREKKANTRMG